MSHKTRLKIVPDDDPNADGEWIEVTRRLGHSSRSWRQLEALYRDDIPEGHHMVSIET